MNVRKQLYIAISILLSVMTIGVVGYMLISDDTFIDALYMTVITVSTVGFGLLHPLSVEGKLFTIFMIILSILLYGYILKVITEIIASGVFLKELKLNKMQKKIDVLSNHTIVCGFGRNGQQAYLKLKKFNQPVVVVELKDKAFSGDYNMLYVEGDATDDDVLNLAGIKKAKNLIVALPSDADNLFITLSARQINKDLVIISRASDESTMRKLKIAGADNIIMPDKLGGDHMASLVVTPDIIEFVDMLSIDGEYSSNLQEIIVDELPKSYISKSLLDLDLRRKTGCNVIGFKTADNDYIVNPEADTILVEGSKLILLGRPEQVEKLKKVF